MGGFLESTKHLTCPHCHKSIEYKTVAKGTNYEYTVVVQEDDKKSEFFLMVEPERLSEEQYRAIYEAMKAHGLAVASGTISKEKVSLQLPEQD